MDKDHLMGLSFHWRTEAQRDRETGRQEINKYIQYYSNAFIPKISIKCLLLTLCAKSTWVLREITRRSFRIIYHVNQSVT